MTYYKKNHELLDAKEVARQKKLINLYNQVNGTSINTASVGISTIHKDVCPCSVFKSNCSYKYFGYMIRNGKPFKPDVVHAEERREALRKKA